MVEKALPHIVCCLTRAEVQQALLGRLGPVASVTCLSDRSAVRAAVARHAGVLVIAEIVDSLGSRLSSLLIRDWRDTFDVPVIAIVRPVTDEVRLIAETVRAGVDEVVLLGVDDVAHRVMEVVQKREALERSSIHGLLADAADCGTVDLIETRVRDGRQVSAQGLARDAGVSERTLARRFALVGLPAPATILRWVRLLLTLEELRRARCSVTRATKHYGYSSNAAFRTTLRQLTGMSPSEARRPLGYQRALAAFESIMRRPQRTRTARHAALVSSLHGRGTEESMYLNGSAGTPAQSVIDAV